MIMKVGDYIRCVTKHRNYITQITGITIKSHTYKGLDRNFAWPMFENHDDVELTEVNITDVEYKERKRRKVGFRSVWLKITTTNGYFQVFKTSVDRVIEEYDVSENIFALLRKDDLVFHGFTETPYIIQESYEGNELELTYAKAFVTKILIPQYKFIQETQTQTDILTDYRVQWVREEPIDDSKRLY